MNKKSEYVPAHHKQETPQKPPIHTQQTVKHSAHSTHTKTLKSLGGTSGVRKQHKIQVTILLIEPRKSASVNHNHRPSSLKIKGLN